MEFFIQLIAQYAPWIYFFCSLVALYQIYRVWLVRTERRQAVFALEREKAVRDLYRIFSVVLILLVVMGTTYFTATVAADALGIDLTEPTVQPEPFAFSLEDLTTTPAQLDTTAVTVTNLLTATDAQSPTLAGEPPTSTIDTTNTVADPAAATQPLTTTLDTTDEFAAPTQPPAPTPEPEPVAPEPVAAPPNCPDERNVITSPGPGQTVSGVISIAGTATHEQFSYYKIEYAPPGGEFAWLLENRAPVVNGTLGTIDTSPLSNGAWTMQVVVVDQSGNFIDPPCQVTLTVQN